MDSELLIRRALARAIDLALYVAVQIWSVQMSVESAVRMDSDPMASSLWLTVFLTVFHLVYLAGMEAAAGATIGKFVFGLRVTDSRGSYPNLLAALKRNLLIGLYPVVSVLGLVVEAVSYFASSNHVRLGDTWAGTRVLRADDAAILTSELGGNTASDLPTTPTPMMRPCPYCAEPVRPEAIKCKHCHSEIPSVNAGPSPSDSPKKVYVGYCELCKKNRNLLPSGCCPKHPEELISQRWLKDW